MSPFQAESLLTEFLLAQGNFAEEAPSELLRLSQDARKSAKERGGPIYPSSQTRVGEPRPDPSMG